MSQRERDLLLAFVALLGALNLLFHLARWAGLIVITVGGGGS